MVFKALILILWEVTKEWEMDVGERSRGFKPAGPCIRKNIPLRHDLSTPSFSRLGVGRGGSRDVLRSVFQISISAGSPIVHPFSAEQRESESFWSEVLSRQWLMSQISMVTFSQRSANSLILRAIINRG